MQFRKILITSLTGAALAGLAVTAVPGVAGATGKSTAQSAAAVALAKNTLVTSSGRTITPAAAAKLAGAAANVRGHDSHAPAKPIATPTRGMQPNSVIGTDSRFQVTNTTTFPNSAVVLINRSGIGLWCTGWMVGKDTLLSAGHCVTNGAGTWYSGLSFVPGSNGGNAPFGTCYARAIYAFTAWASGADSNYDTSIIKLNCTVGYSTGWFGTWWQSASPDGLFTRVQGYPGDKPSTQWESYDYVRASSADRLYYQNDTVGGESGSPVWQYRSGPYCSGACGMGVHTNGSNGTNNSGVRFTQAKLNAIYGIVNAP